MKFRGGLVIIYKGVIDGMPPLVTLCKSLAAMNVEFTLIVQDCSDDFLEEMRPRTVHRVFWGVSRRFSIFGRLFHWSMFSLKVNRILRSMPRNRTLWIGSLDTAIPLYLRLRRERFVLQCHELYDRAPLYRFALSRLAEKASDIVVSEGFRASLFRLWFHLERDPHVVMNKPFFHPRKRFLPVEDAAIARRLLEIKRAKQRIVLFSGFAGAADRDVRPLARALALLGRGWHFVLLGGADPGYVREIMDINPRATHFETVRNPGHLNVISHAHIGAVCYSYQDLNNLFCAPNKIWEYSGFGLPMIGNDVPGLRRYIEGRGCGLAVNMATDGVEDIVRAVKAIDKGFGRYSRASAEFYDSYSVTDAVSSVLEGDRSGTAFRWAKEPPTDPRVSSGVRNP